jgi:predicted transcriptional regulator
VAGPKRTVQEREEDLEKVALLHRRGYNQRQISEKLGVTQQQVSYDLAALRKRYAETQLEETGAAIAEKVEQFREVFKEAWEAWERSKQSSEDLPANEFLRTIRDVLCDESKLRGLITNKNEHSGPGGKPMEINATMEATAKYAKYFGLADGPEAEAGPAAGDGPQEQVHP